MDRLSFLRFTEFAIGSLHCGGGGSINNHILVWDLSILLNVGS